MKEYAIWGVPPGYTQEELLHTKSKSLQEAQNIAKILTEKYDCKNVRIQTIDLSDGIINDFRNTVSK